MEASRKLIQTNLFANPVAREQLEEALKKLQHFLGENAPNRILGLTACTLAAYKLTSRAIQLRRNKVHELLQAVRTVSDMKIASRTDLGEGLHSASTEAFYFEGAYLIHWTPIVQFPSPMMGSV